MQDALDNTPGWAIRDICPLVGLSDVPQDYLGLLAKYRARRRVKTSYQRPPAAKAGDVERYHKRGAFSKIPPELRLVAEEVCPWRFLEAAIKLDFPIRRIVDQVPATHAEAAQKLAQLVEEQADIEALRDGWIRDMETDWKAIDWLDEMFAGGASNDAPIMQRSRLASLGLMAELSGWEATDRTICYDLYVGMTNAGAGTKEEPMCPRDSGLFRPRGKMADYTTSELHAGTARPWKGEWVAAPGGGRAQWVERPGDPLPSSAQWHQDLKSALEVSARQACKGAGVTEQEVKAAIKRHVADGGEKGGAVAELLSSVSDEEARDRLESLIFCDIMSRDESETDPPTLLKPMDEAAYKRWAEELTPKGIGGTRPARRTVVNEGWRADGTRKRRGIDNFRVSGGNGSVMRPDSVDMPSFMWPIWMVIVFVQAFAARALPRPKFTYGLDDMKMAYRMVHALLWPFVTCLVAYYSFRMGGMAVQCCPGHLFGAAASNSNFSRVPRLICTFCVLYFLVCYVHYVDDFMNVDLASARQSAARVLAAVTRRAGYIIEKKKHKPNRPSNQGLGAEADLSKVESEGTAEVRPVDKKVRDFIESLEKLEAAGRCTQQQAMELKGKGRWLTSQLMARAGTAALQPFAQREQEPERTDWTPEMSISLEFLKVVFSDEFLTPITVDVTTDERERKRKPVLAFSDAAYHEEVDETTGEKRRVCAVNVDVFDLETMRHSSSHGVVPEEYYDFFVLMKTYIGRGELGMGVAMLWTMPRVFRDRDIIHFVDNAPALSNLVNGYAGQPDMARLVCMFHLALVALRCDWYGEWIPSKANLGDIMTRPERYHELLEGLRRYEWYRRVNPEGPEEYELKLPPLGDSMEQLREWMRAMRARAAEAA